MNKESRKCRNAANVLAPFSLTIRSFGLMVLNGVARSEPVGQTLFHRNTGVPLALPVHNRGRFCGLESLAKPVAHFINKP